MEGVDGVVGERPRVLGIMDEALHAAVEQVVGAELAGGTAGVATVARALLAGGQGKDVQAGNARELLVRERGGDVVEPEHSEPGDICNVTLTLGGSDLLDDPSLRQGQSICCP